MAYTTINKSTDNFNTKLYSGTGSSQNITGVGHQPDLTWIKSRSTTHEHKLTDAVRGVTKVLCSNDSQAEFTDSQGLTAFASDGFSIGTDSYYNTSGHDYASWNWKAGGSASSNSNGSITSSVSVNTTAGFSIVKYTGTGSNATIGHGLGVVPKMIIVKRLSNSENWTVYHNSIGNTKYLNLDDDAAATTYNMWQNYTPTSSVFYITTHNRLNANGDDYIAYCFAEKTGYSKFGSYTGNNNADGTFVYTGFKPAFILIKNTTTANQAWFIFDNKRDVAGNENNNYLIASSNAAERGETGNGLDMLSNGFKLRATGGFINDTGTFIYMAFGQSLVGSNNAPCTAR